jgi:hypothetical protein
MSNRIRVAALASMVVLGIVLAAPAFAQDDLNAHRIIRASDQERSYTPPPVCNGHLLRAPSVLSPVQ